MPATTVLVLVDGDVASGNPLLAPLKPKAQVRHFPPLRQREVPAWVQRRASELGLRLTPRAASLLAELVGNDLWTLASELDKLAAYALNGQPLDEAEVRDLVSAAREVGVFPMIDAVVEGRAAQATKLFRQLVIQGEEVPRVFNMILRQYRHLVLAREMLMSGARAAEIGERLNLPPFALERLLQQVERYDLSRLKGAYRRLLAADVAIKRGIYGEELALELLLHDLAAIASPLPQSSSG